MAHDLWPWLALAGLGAYHGVNPAMGWLFAAAPGLHRQEHGPPCPVAGESNPPEAARGIEAQLLHVGVA